MELVVGKVVIPIAHENIDNGVWLNHPESTLSNVGYLLSAIRVEVKLDPDHLGARVKTLLVA